MSSLFGAFGATVVVAGGGPASASTVGRGNSLLVLPTIEDARRQAIPIHISFIEIGGNRYLFDPIVDRHYAASNPDTAFMDKAGRGFRLPGVNRSASWARPADTKARLDATPVSVFEAFTREQQHAIRVGDGDVPFAVDRIQEVIDDVSKQGGGSIAVPIGQYPFSKGLRLRPGVSLIGEQKGVWGSAHTRPVPGVKLIRTFADGPLLYSTQDETITSVSLENLILQGDGRGTGDGLNLHTANDVIFRRVWADRMPSNSFVVGRGGTSFHNYFYNCYSFFPGLAGWVVQSDWMRLIDCWSDGASVGVDFPDNKFCGAHAHLVRMHFEEFAFAAIAIRGDPAVGGNGSHSIQDCVFFSRPYNDQDPGYCLLLDGEGAAAGCSSISLNGGHMIFQQRQNPAFRTTKQGKIAIRINGARCGYNLLSPKSISGFERGIVLNDGTPKNIVKDTNIDNCLVGLDNGGSSTVVDTLIFTNNKVDLLDRGNDSHVVNNIFEVAPALGARSFASGNNMGSLGDWLPRLSIGPSDEGVAYARQKGRFEKSGRTVTAHIDIALSRKGSTMGPLSFDLPIAPSGICGPAIVWIDQAATKWAQPVLADIDVLTGRLLLRQGSIGPLTHADLTDKSAIRLTMIYEA